jgi:hypothetical protein
MGDNSQGISLLQVATFMEALQGWPQIQPDRPTSRVAELKRFVLALKYRTVAMRRAGIPARITRGSSIPKKSWHLTKRALDPRLDYRRDSGSNEAQAGVSPRDAWDSAHYPAIWSLC